MIGIFNSVCVCGNLQDGTACGVVGHNVVFNISLPTDVGEGFVAYGTTSHGYADFDNLLIEDNTDKLIDSAVSSRL